MKNLTKSTFQVRLESMVKRLNKKYNTLPI